ncbi:MAG: hypothetical protein V9G12_02685, partial [Microthrixaceae bacterium]
MFSLTAAATIGTGSGVTAGANIALATCHASMSTGPSARTAGDRIAKVGVAEPSVTIAKSVAPATVAAGSPATFTITVSKTPRPAPMRPSPRRTTLPWWTRSRRSSPLSPPPEPSCPTATPPRAGCGGGPADRTLTATVASLQPGATTTFAVRAKLASTAAAASTFTNNVTATATSLPAAPGRSVSPTV